MRRLVLAVVAVLALSGTGCSDGDDATPTTTGSTTTSTTAVDDAAVLAAIVEDMRPALASAFDAETADCILAVFSDGARGEVLADDVAAAYEERCGVAGNAVTGALLASELTDRGVSEDDAACVRAALEALPSGEAETVDDESVEGIFTGCGLDPHVLEGGDHGH